MLKLLKINNFLLFKKQDISFDGSFSAITGETGSGKSMFIKALHFVLGSKYDSNSEISVIAEFKINKNNKNLAALLEASDIEIEDDIIILRRTQSEDNKGKNFINDVPVTLKLLRNVSAELIEFHSQHKQLDAFNQNNSLNIIDEFVEEKELIADVSSYYQKISKIDLEIAEYKKNKQEFELDKDIIAHHLEELKLLNIKENEELELIEKKKLYNDKVKIVKALDGLISICRHEDGLIQKLNKIQRDFSRLECEIGLDQYIENSISHLNELQNQAEYKLRDLDLNESLEEVEERLSKIKELSRKHRCPSDQLKQIEINYDKRQTKLFNIDKLIADRNAEKELCMRQYFIAADQLSEKRKLAAKKIEIRILEELKQLRLEQIELSVDISSQLRPITIKGIDKAKFLIKTNEGFPFAEVHEIASGGELSRIMLAFKVALAESNQKTTIIFDEIDSGTGGAVAETIGNRLKKLAIENQVIAISHQPQVAAKADQHLLVTKSSASSSISEIHNLNYDEKIAEIARMLGGINVSKSAIDAAISLINN